MAGERIDPRKLMGASPPLLLASQQEQIFDWISARFDPRRFEFNDDGRADYRGQLAEVRLRDSSFRLTLHQYESRWEVDMSPGPDVREASAHGIPWSEMKDVFTIWLNSLDRELSARNPWAEIERELQLMAAPTAHESNEPFSADEQRAISARVRAVRDYAQQQDLTAEALEELNTRLDVLEEASTRVGRKDWKLIVLGTFSTMVMEHAFAPDFVRMCLSIFSRGIEHLLGIPGPPPELLA